MKFIDKVIAHFKQSTNNNRGTESVKNINIYYENQMSENTTKKRK